MVTDERVLAYEAVRRRHPTLAGGARTGHGRASVVCSSRRPASTAPPPRQPTQSESRFSIEGPVDTQTTTNNAATAARRTHAYTRARAARHRFPAPHRPPPYRDAFTRTHTRERGHARSLCKPFGPVDIVAAIIITGSTDDRPDITYTRARAGGRTGGERKCSHA